VECGDVRWGPDGVGLQFILTDDQDLRHGKTTMMDAASREEFELFLAQLKFEG
jgi:hypothetical protein